MREAKNCEFVDTNILVYCYDISSQEKRIKAKEVVLSLWENKSGCLSVQVMQEFLVAVTQKVPQPLNYEKAAQIIKDLSLWHYHSPIAGDVLEALNIKERNNISFWDAMIINSAIVCKCDIIWSEDMNHDQVIEGVRIINPFLT